MSLVIGRVCVGGRVRKGYMQLPPIQDGRSKRVCLRMRMRMRMLMTDIEIYRDI